MTLKPFRKFVDAIFSKKKYLKTDRFIVFSFFLVFSFAMWYLHKLGGEYVVDLKIPLKIAYAGSDKMLVEEGSASVLVSVKAKGYSILRMKLQKGIAPLPLDLSSFKINHYASGSDLYYLLSNSLSARISAQLPSSLKIESISPDTLFFNLSAASSKVVPVRFESRLSFAPQFMQVGGVRVWPDSISISGPASIVRAMGYISTESIKISGLKAPYEGVAKLKRNGNIRLSSEVVRFSVDVTKYTETSMRLPLIYEGEDNSEQVVLIPKTAEVSFRVALKDYKKLQPSMFRLVVNRDGKTLSNWAKIRVEESPSFVANLRVSPEYVEIYSQGK